METYIFLHAKFSKLRFSKNNGCTLERNDSIRSTKSRLNLKYLQSCLYLRMSLDTARQIAWNPFPVSPSSDVRVKYNEYPDERMRDGIVEPQNVPNSGDLDWGEKKIIMINSLFWLLHTKLSLKLYNRAFPKGLKPLSQSES